MLYSQERTNKQKVTFCMRNSKQNDTNLQIKYKDWVTFVSNY